MDQPFQCSICSFSCMQIEHLLRHIRKAHLEKKFLCKHCDYKTNEASSLRKHEKRMHKAIHDECSKTVTLEYNGLKMELDKSDWIEIKSNCDREFFFSKSKLRAISGYFDNFFSNYPVCQLKILISSTTLEILQIYTHMR